jgi:hypothetical protein
MFVIASIVDITARKLAAAVVAEQQRREASLSAGCPMVK